MSHDAGVLLDVDGTLIDNSYLHAVAWYRALRDDGRVETMARLHRLVGKGGDMFTRDLYGTVREDLDEAHGRHVKEFHGDMSPLPGAADLVRAIHDAGLRVVLSTSASPPDVEWMMEMLGVSRLIDAQATADDVRTTKPAPDVVEVALRKSNLRAENAVYVGDTGWDIEAAGRAKLRCIGVETGGWAPQELREAGAAAVYHDLRELVEQFDSSIIGELAR